MDFASLQAIANAAATVVDHTEVSEGFERELPAAGMAMARFTGYVETGKQPQNDYQGKAKPPAAEVRLTFDLLTPARTNPDGTQWPGHVREITVDGVKKTICDKLHLTLAIKLNDRAGFTKLFKAMRYGRDNVKHMAQMLGEPFLLEVVHQKAKTSDRVYATMRKDSNFTIGAPFVPDVNNFGSQIPAPVPQVLDSDTFRLFVWDKPTQETWQMLFIEGTREVTKDGVKSQVSKNFLQGAIMSAVNFQGSPVHTMLSGLGVEIDQAAMAAAQGLTRADTEEDDSPDAPPAGHPAAAGADQMMLQAAAPVPVPVPADPQQTAAYTPEQIAAMQAQMAIQQQQPVQATQAPPAPVAAAVAPPVAQQQPIQTSPIQEVAQASVPTVARERGKPSPGKARRTSAEVAEDKAADAPTPAQVAEMQAVGEVTPTAQAAQPSATAAPVQLDTSNMTPENIAALKAMGVLQ